MRWFEVTGWVALFLNVWGNWLLTAKTTAGWPIRLASNAAWIVYSCFVVTAPALLANHVTFAVINIVGWQRWSKERRK